MTFPAQSAPLLMSPEVLARVLPFYVLVGDDGLVHSAGPALLKIVTAERLLGRPVFEALRILKPRRLDPGKSLRDGLGVRLTVGLSGLSSPGDMGPGDMGPGDMGPTDLGPADLGPTDLGLYGMAFPVQLAGNRQILIALTPGVNARPFVEVHGLRISDFGPADGSADILPLLAMQQDMLEDGRKQSAKLRAARDAAEHLANHDTLTELPNRRALMTRLALALTRETVAVVHVDLDRFKQINDTHGHAAGDAALKHAAAAITQVFGDSALCARLGGDEFVAMVLGHCSDDELTAMAHRVIDQISQPFTFKGDTLQVGASVGLAIATPEDHLTADGILHHADLALYEVKREGRMKAVLCTPEILTKHLEFQTLSSDIRRGLAAEEFVAHFQPQIEARTGTVVGFEALARWEHPLRGLLFPKQFLAATYRAGLIQAFDKQIRRSALNSLKHWDEAGVSVPKVSINITTQDLVDPQFRDVLLWDLDARDLHPGRIVLEMVESVLYDENAVEITQACQALVNAGFALALDDFGTGYASILSLVNLPMSTIKIDRAFTAGVAREQRKQVLAQSMVGMAATLGLEVLAEGVDDDADVAVMQAMGCELFQSFHFGSPMAPMDALRWVKDRPMRGSALSPLGDGTAAKEAETG